MMTVCLPRSARNFNTNTRFQSLSQDGYVRMGSIYLLTSARLLRTMAKYVSNHVELG